MAKIFAYKGIIGISAVTVDDSAEDGFVISDAVVNDWQDPNQLGFVCEADKCEFSQEAIDLLETIKPSADCIGDVDIFGDADEKVIFNWLGGAMVMINPSDTEGSRDYTPSLLKHVNVVENNPPQDFCDAVDAMLQA